MPGEPIYIFYHLSKSGGTTLDAHLARHLQWDREYINLSNWGRHYRTLHDRPPFEDRSLAEREAARVLSGHRAMAGMHALLPGREPRYFTIVRDPAERCVSLYNFRRSRGDTDLDFDEWYSADYLSRYRNSAVRFYAERVFGDSTGDDPETNHAIARRLLERCWLVTVLPRLDDVLALLSKALDIPADWTVVRSAGGDKALELPHHPANGERISRYVQVDDAIRERVWHDSAQDVRLWQWAAERTLPSAQSLG